MDYMQSEELIRAEILDQLKRRELHLPNTQNLSLEQLQQIYNRFIVPHPRRERREQAARVMPSAPEEKFIHEIPIKMEQLVKCITVVCMAGEKRPFNPSERFTMLESAPKRIRID